MKRLWQALTGSKAENGHTGALQIIRASALSSTGAVREVNEDAVSVVYPPRQEALLSRGVLAVVADGMGGAKGGSCASEIAIETITRLYLQDQSDPPSALKKALEAANSRIYNISQKDANLCGMGTTCVAMALTPEQAWVAWVGDSRVYLIRNHQIFQMTEDHSVVAGLVREGLLTSNEAAWREDRHILTRALGTRPEVEISVWEQSMPVRAKDRFLLCSDGLHDLVTDCELLQLAADRPLEESTAALLNRANEQGGNDNISSIILEVGDGSSELTDSEQNREDSAREPVKQ
jgi:serine/threonine protein phosphatase PrpC